MRRNFTSVPRKNRHSPALSVLWPFPIYSLARPTHANQLRSFFPLFRPHPAISPTLLKQAHIRANLANARNRSCGPKPLPQAGYRPQASVGASLLGALRHRKHGRLALSSSVARRHFCDTPESTGHYGLAQDRLRRQLRIARNHAEMSRFRSPAFAGATLLGTPNSLNQTLACDRLEIPYPFACNMPVI